MPHGDNLCRWKANHRAEEGSHLYLSYVISMEKKMNQRQFKILTGGFLTLIAVAGTLLLNRVASSAGGANAIVDFTCCDYSPQVVTVTVGESVTWRGNFGFHPLQQAAGPASDSLPSGGFTASGGTEFSKTFTEAGTMYYLCTAHGTLGGQMRGEVRVLGSGQATTTPPGTATVQPTVVVTPSGPACLTYDVTFGPENNTVTTTASGRGIFVLNTQLNTLSYVISYTNLTSAETNAHFHAFVPPAQVGPPIVSQPLSADGAPKTGVWNYPSEAIEKQILDGHVYVNIHSANHTGGEIRANLVNGVACKKIFLPLTRR
jgi:plastocyanin